MPPPRIEMGTLLFPRDSSNQLSYGGNNFHPKTTLFTIILKFIDESSRTALKINKVI